MFSMPQAINEFTERIYKKFLEKLQSDGKIPASLIDEIEKLMDNDELTNPEAILRAYESQEVSHAKD